jgi:hypothetical protein
VVLPATIDVAIVCAVSAVLNAVVPPDPAVPDTTRSVLLSCAVSFVHPVGADVCWNNIIVPDAMGTCVGTGQGSMFMYVPVFTLFLYSIIFSFSAQVLYLHTAPTIVA